MKGERKINSPFLIVGAIEESVNRWGKKRKERVIKASRDPMIRVMPNRKIIFPKTGNLSERVVFLL